RTRQRDAQRETPLVRDRDRVPTGWLADDAPVRRSERRAVARARAGRRFLLDRTDDRDAHASDAVRRGGDEGGEWSLRVDRAASAVARSRAEVCARRCRPRLVACPRAPGPPGPPHRPPARAPPRAPPRPRRPAPAGRAAPRPARHGPPRRDRARAPRALALSEA